MALSRITRRDLFKAGLTAAAAAAVLPQGPAVVRAGANKPNVLFLMDDQHRGDCLGCDGNPVVQTPNLDRLAAEGARFRCAYSSTPTCTPARAAILTGMSPWNHGMLGYSQVAEQYPIELPKSMGESGYQTLGIGKMHWSPQRNLHGFDATILDESGRVQSEDFKSDYRCWFASQAPNLDPDATGIGWNSYQAGEYVLPERLHPTTWTADVACNFLDGFQGPKPFFLKVSFARPHSPYDPPQRWMDHYKDADLPAARTGDWSEKYRSRSGEDDTIWHGDLGAEQVRRSGQGYYGSVSFIDEQVGRILETLEKRRLLEETLILFTSDHGDMTGDHHMWRKSYAYDPSARIPMLMRWPEGLITAERGQVREEPVELRDLLPTCLDAAESEPHMPVDGGSLLKLLNGSGGEWRPWIDLEHNICYDKTNHWNALTDGRTKYIYHAFDGQEQLFDLRQDPGETTDLAGDSAHVEALQTWRGRMVAHLETRGEEWVKGGRLIPRPQDMNHSPNYPKPTINK